MHNPDPFLEALRGAYERHAPDRLARFPAFPGREPLGGEPGTEIPHSFPHDVAAVPRIPKVPVQNPDEGPLRAPFDLADWEERAAIMEYDGGLSREEAERVAWEDLRQGRRSPATI
jgi:hypothetical protein